MNFIQRLIFNRVSKWAQHPSGVRILPWITRTAGQRVDHDTALTYSAVWRAVNLISGTIAGLPWRVMQREMEGGRGVSRHLVTHPAQNLLEIAPNEETDAFQFKQTLLSHCLLWGNGFAEIERDMSNRPVALYQIEPERVSVERTTDGRLVYDISNGSEGNTVLTPDRMLHVKGLGFDGLVGYSVIGYAARSVGMGLATEQYGADFFQNGAHHGGVLEHPSTLSNDAIEHLKASLIEATTGKNTHKPLVLEEGMQWKNRSIPPDDAQFLETRKFNVSEVARWYGVPPHKLMEMEKSTFNNIEQQNIEFATDTVLPWVKRLEHEANIKLISPAMRGRVFTKINMNGVLRGDTASRGTWYQTLFNMGVFSVNDILELEDRNPIGPEGDKRLVQLNLTTLEKVGEDQAEPAESMETILTEVVDRVNRREQARISKAITHSRKKENPRQQFVDYMARFTEDHRAYMAKALSAPVAAFKIPVDIEAFISGHLINLEIAALQAFDGATEDSDYKPMLTMQQIIEAAE